MQRSRVFVVATFAFLSVLLRAECIKDHRTANNSGLLIADFTIAGTQTLSSDELATIESEITGSCFDENSDEIEERVRALFQDRGYFGAVLNSLRIKPNDPVAVPKAVTVEADVLEGPRYTLVGNRLRREPRRQHPHATQRVSPQEG